MRRRYRIGLSILAALGSVTLVIALVVMGSASEGPLSFTLRRVGALVSGMETRAVQSIRGPGRSAELDWLGPLRTDADSLRHPHDFLLGVYAEHESSTLESVAGLEETLGFTFPLIQLYTAWGEEPDHSFPGRIVEAIHALGSIPVITWEPWLSTFENRLHPNLPLREGRDREGLMAVAAGDYDFYLEPWAREAARWGKPLLVRLGHEMNDPYRYPWGPQNNQPQDFIAAWRHVVDLFREAGATNVVWVWSPHVAYEGYESYWPGDDYVDWVATGALNYGTVAYWSQWWSFDEIFGRHYDFLKGFGKPIMIAEFGTLAVGGDRAEWYRAAVDGLEERYPGVKALLFFYVENDATVTRQALDWGFDDDPAVVQAVREGLGKLGAAEH